MMLLTWFGRTLEKTSMLILIPLGVVGLFLSQTRDFSADPSITALSSDRSLALSPDGQVVDLETGSVRYPDRPEWARLPGLDTTWETASTSTVAPRVAAPTASADWRLNQSDSDSFRTLEIRYANGAVYHLSAWQISPHGPADNFPIESIFYFGPPPPLLIRWALRALPFVAVGSFTVGLGSLVVHLTGSRSTSRRAVRRLPADLCQPLADRWLSRSRHYRFIGGVVGVILYYGIEPMRVGSLLSVQLPSMPMHLIGGIAIGGALAEIHLIHRSRKTASRTAILHTRRRRDYTTPIDDAAMSAIALVSASLLGLGLVDVVNISLWPGLAPLAIAAATWLMQRLVAVRRRPATGREIRDADDLVRFLALTRGFTRPAIATALLVLSRNVLLAGGPGWTRWLALGLIALGFGWHFSGLEARIPALARSFSTP